MKTIHFLNPINLKNKIRLGPNGDGGYVIYNQTLKDIDVLVTYGVGWEIRFEKHFNELTGKEVLMFDPTMFGKHVLDIPYFKSLLFSGNLLESLFYVNFARKKWKELKALRQHNILFVNEGIAANRSKKYNNFKTHIEQYGLKEKRLLLKIDIEGNEYDIFEDDDIFLYFNNVVQIIIEFHDLDVHFDRFKKIIQKLKYNYEVIHVHGNNWGGQFSCIVLPEDKVVNLPKVIEMTFLRKSNISDSDIVDEKFIPPIKLDFPNNPYEPDLDFNVSQ
ncbi:FkbM family methyltransferase [Pedobacter sp. JY14-1]|uniref:FkbM family methyltransferase n=1 Tax=Pedobacter sp. JY14-1 TaxID=3034151 RepID=UPI0023E22653|nr:FkbM family methyltransferase [Pedobacter sp. JY14-1]